MAPADTFGHLHYGRCDHVAAKYDGRIIVAGGILGTTGGLCNVSEVWDASSGKFEPDKSLPMHWNRFGAAAALLGEL